MAHAPRVIPDSSAVRSLCTGIALAVKAFREELELHLVAAEKVEISDGRRLIRRSLRELKLEYGDVQRGPATRARRAWTTLRPNASWCGICRAQTAQALTLTRASGRMTLTITAQLDGRQCGV
jgi:hypothetical protein